MFINGDLDFLLIAHLIIQAYHFSEARELKDLTLLRNRADISPRGELKLEDRGFL